MNQWSLRALRMKSLSLQESRVLKFWFAEGTDYLEKVTGAYEFFKELVRPDDFPRGKAWRKIHAIQLSWVFITYKFLRYPGPWVCISYIAERDLNLWEKAQCDAVKTQPIFFKILTKDTP